MIRIILISSVVPSTYSAGHLVLHRHLVNEPEIDLVVMDVEPKRRSVRKLARKMVACLARGSCGQYAQDIMSLWKGGWIDPELPAPPESDVVSVVMTVAQGDAYHAAARYAKRYDLSLVSIFHDWWPDIPRLHKPFRSIIQDSFVQLYQDSALALCVSVGMKKSLGPHPNSKVLYPMPAAIDDIKVESKEGNHKPFRLLYSGNLTEYGAMLRNALELLKNHKGIRLEVRGASATWPENTLKEMTERGLLLPYADRGDFKTWLESADAFLITQRFGENSRQLMKTNFPSKMVEFAQLGKPLVVWGPAEASAAVWAEESGQALVVDQEDPKCLREALEKLSNDKAEQDRLASGAKKAATGPFNPERIQSDFLRWLLEVAA
jgi:glycosyltransferase involved in cell wall biosynthesis